MKNGCARSPCRFRKEARRRTKKCAKRCLWEPAEEDIRNDASVGRRESASPRVVHRPIQRENFVRSTRPLGKVAPAPPRHVRTSVKLPQLNSHAENGFFCFAVSAGVRQNPAFLRSIQKIASLRSFSGRCYGLRFPGVASASVAGGSPAHFYRINRQAYPQLTEQPAHACKNSKRASKLDVLSAGVREARVEIFVFRIQQVQ